MTSLRQKMIRELELSRKSPRTIEAYVRAVAQLVGQQAVVPVAWYPRLSHGTSEERNHWRLIGNGRGIHWPDLDEDISVQNLLAGQPSRQSQTSFKRWLDQRAHNQGKKAP